MKRDLTGKFVNNWPSEAKQRINLSLTKTALQLLNQQARLRGISRSELVERLARSLTQQPASSTPEPLKSQLHPENASDPELDDPAGVTSLQKLSEIAAKVPALLDSQDLETFIELMPVAIWLARDPACKQMIANGVAHKLMRTEPGSLATATPPEGTYPFKFKLQRNGRDIPSDELSMQKAGRTGQETMEEAELVFEDGVVRYIYGRAVPLRDAAGTVCGVIGAYLDITESKQFEAELRRREQQFKTLAENAPDLISRIDANFRHLYVSPAIESATGLPATVFMGKTNAELGMPAELNQRWQASLEQVFSTGQNTTIEFEFPTLKGTRYYQANLVPEYGSKGSIESVLCIAHDVTEYKQVEQALRISESRFRRIFDGNLLGMGFYHRDGRIFEANDALLNLLGYTREEFRTQGLQWQDLTPPEYAVADQKAIQEALALGYCTPYEKEFIRKDGSRVSVLGGGGHFEETDQSGVFYIIDLTERRRAEQAQWEAEERLRVAIKNSPLTVFNQDRELRYTWIYNPTFDYPPEAVIGKQDCDLVTAEDAQVLTQIKQSVLLTGKGRREEVKLTLWERDWYYDLTVEPMYDEAGEVVGVTCAAVDITERKQAEAEREGLLVRERAARWEAEQSQQQLTTIFETSPVGMGFLDHEQRFIAINQALAEINGLTREEHLGHSIAELFGTVDPGIVELFAKIYAIGEPFVSPEFAVNVPGRDDRRPGYYYVYYLPIRSSKGPVQSTIVYVVDVTERVRLEQGQRFLSEASKVLASSLDYQTTLERVAQLTVPSLADWCTVHVIEEDDSIQQLAIAHVDPSKVSWARELEKKYPFDPNQPRGAALSLRTGASDLVSEIPDEMLVQAARDPEHLQILREVGFKAVMTVPLKVHDKILGVISFIAAESGRRYHENDVRLAEELAHRAALAIDNARLYRTAQRDRSQAEAANRIKDEFLAVLSHELRTPLNPILGWAKLLRTRSFDPVQSARALETIERNARLQTQLIEDLLDISRILQGKLSLNVTPVNLVAVVAAALDTVRLSAEAKSIRLRKVFAPDIGHILGDSGRLQQVVWNLLSNAIKFTPAGGQVEVHLERKGMEVQITVSDTGIGITADFLPYVFDYFRQADSSSTRRFGGLGLGLAIVRHIVELHGGTVSVHSLGKGKGTTFGVRLPTTGVAGEGKTPSGTLESVVSLRGVKVLAVDDDADMRDLTAFVLQQAQAEVRLVASAQEVLKVLSKEQPDVLIADIGMPEINGYTLLRSIRCLSAQKGGQIPAIALTAYAGEFNHRQALEAGFQLHLSKPVEPEVLVKAVARLVGRC